jgi:MOSC domain-containing protein YiiM
MRIVSVNAGMPRLFSWKESTFKTGIFKSPVNGRVMLRESNLDGDSQADLTVHGGVNKAVYVYPSEHYAFWRQELACEDLPWGSFGENFSTEGLIETDVRMGDEYSIGSAIVRVTTPRLPCYKLAAKFRRDDMIQRFLRSGFSGFYLSVVREGEVGAGDEIAIVRREEVSVTIAELNQLYLSATPDIELIQRALQIPSLPDGWRERFHAKLESISKTPAI